MLSKIVNDPLVSQRKFPFDFTSQSTASCGICPVDTTFITDRLIFVL